MSGARRSGSSGRKERREQFIGREILCERLDIRASAMAGSGTHRITFNSALLRDTLGHAPESVTPAVLYPAGDFYFVEVLRVFETMLEGDGAITLPLSEIAATLYDSLDAAVWQAGEASGSRILEFTNFVRRVDERRGVVVLEGGADV
jgi:hypothetical protein